MPLRLTNFATLPFYLKNLLKGIDIGMYLCYNTDIKEKEDFNMGTEAERQDTRKAMAFDLCNIIDENPAQETYTKEEVKKLIKVYISTAEQK